MTMSVGVDLGQSHDPTAIAIVEHVGGEHRLRHLERRPLGEPYPVVAEHISALARAVGGRLVIDHTGVGRGVVDLLRDRGLSVVAVTITAGKTTHSADDGWKVPKAELVRGLQCALERGRLKIPRTLPLAAALVTEVSAFRVTISPGGRTRYGGHGEHDDLVLATALALWRPAIAQ